MGVGCVYLPAKAADDGEDNIKTPQAAALQFTNGRIVRGSVLEVNDKEIRFQLNRPGTAPARYKLGTVRAIQTANSVWLYNADKKRFEKVKSQAVKPLPQKPGQPRERPAPPPKHKAEELQTVIAEGVGADAEEALKDAFRAAIRQVVGALVDSETLVKDDKIISDKVLTYSDGVIKKYDLLTECKAYEGETNQQYLLKRRKYVDVPVLGGFRSYNVKGFANRRLSADQKGWYLWVLRNIDAQNVRTRWDVYLVDSDRHKSLAGAAAQLSILVSLQDAEGQAIAETEIALTDRSSYHRWLIARNSYSRESVNICLAPMALRTSSGYLDYKPVELYRRHIDMTVAELNKIKSVKCHIVVRPADEKRE